VGLDGAISDGKPKSGGAARFLGREERLEQSRQGFRSHAATRVLHGYLDESAGPRLDVCQAIAFLQYAIARRNYESTTRRHRIAGVVGEVQQHLPQLTRIPDNRPQAGIRAQVEPNRGRQFVLEHAPHIR